MPPLPMTPYEKSHKAGKIALYAGCAALTSCIVYGTVTADFDRMPVPDVGKAAGVKSSETNNILGRPSRDDAIIAGSIPSRFEEDSADPVTSLQVKRVQLPSTEAIRASLAVDKKTATRPKARRFEACLPTCETRDPLVAGVETSRRPDIHGPSVMKAQAVPKPDELQRGRSLLRRGGDFLALVANTPALTIDKGKQAMAHAGQLFQ